MNSKNSSIISISTSRSSDKTTNYTRHGQIDMGKSNIKNIENPRQQCCWEGKYFFDALKAILTRLLFLGHSMLAVWQVSLVTSALHWLMALSFIGLLLETVVILFKRRGQEWSWFQWSIFLYLCAVIPPIWVLQLNNLDHWNHLLNNTNIASEVKQQSSSGYSVGISRDDWMVVIEQGLLVVLIIGRWIMPKGDLTREQLSALLLIHLGTASDIVDFMSILSEPNIVSHNVFLFAILACWTWSLMQFPFVVTSTTDSEDEEEEDDETQTYDYFINKIEKKTYSGRSVFKKKIKIIRRNFFETEAWGIFVSVLMQDGPFVVMRFISIVAFYVKTYTNYFFTAKNALVLCLQVYRLWSIYHEHQNKKKKEQEVKGVEKLNKMYKQAFKSKSSSVGCVQDHK